MKFESDTLTSITLNCLKFHTPHPSENIEKYISRHLVQQQTA